MIPESYFNGYKQIAKDDIRKPFEQDKWRRMVPFRKFIGAKDSDKILEVGCGRSELMKDGDLVGVDIAVEYLQAFHQSHPLVNAAIEWLPFKDGAFDIVVADSMLEHILNLQEGLSSLHRVLRRNGRLFVMVPYREDISVYEWQKEKYGITEHQRTFASADDFVPLFIGERTDFAVPRKGQKLPSWLAGFAIRHLHYRPIFMMCELRKAN